MTQLKHSWSALHSSLTLAALLGVAIIQAPTATAAEQSRHSTSTVRGQAAVAVQYPELNLTQQPADNRKRTPSGIRHASSYNSDFWIYSAGVDFSVDYDHDGHYSSFGISFDVDTSFDFVPVYAVLYLSIDGGLWNEYAVTGNFTLSGHGPEDSVYVQTELESGYPSGYYDHYVEIYDAHTHELLTEYGPHDTSAWHGLPFEGYAHDDFSFGASVSFDFTGTGSLDSAGIALLSLVAATGYLRRRKIRIDKPS